MSLEVLDFCGVRSGDSPTEDSMSQSLARHIYIVDDAYEYPVCLLLGANRPATPASMATRTTHPTDECPDQRS